MKTPNNGVEAAQGQSKMWAIKGLSAKIVTALAALGIATSVETVEGAITITTPVLVSGSGLEQSTQQWQSNIWSSRTISNGITAETISKIVISVSALDAGPNGGLLTFSGVSRMISGVSSPTVGQGYANTFADIDQEIRWGISGQSMTTLWTFNNLGFNNDETRDFNGAGEWIDVSTPFSYTISVPAGGIDYELQNIARVLNADATVRLAGNANGSLPINVSFAQVPEPDVALLAGAAATIALLRRRKEEK